MCSSYYLEHSSPDSLLAFLLSSLLRFHFLSKAYPEHPL